MTGTPTAAETTRRSRFEAPVSPARLELPELAVASCVRFDRCVKVLLVEIRPEGRRRVILAVCRLPDQKVREAHLPGGSNHEIGIRKRCSVKVAGDQRFINLTRRNAIGHDSA